jgi:hypothetical protein
MTAAFWMQADPNAFSAHSDGEADMACSCLAWTTQEQSFRLYFLGGGISELVSPPPSALPSGRDEDGAAVRPA